MRVREKGGGRWSKEWRINESECLIICHMGIEIEVSVENIIVLRKQKEEGI